MRIITGKVRGLKLLAPQGLSVRPTADRVKESVFSILSEKVTGARVLDLFSGSGNLALEAFSRGAAEALCVDNSATSIKYIVRNIEKAKAAEQVKIYKADASRAIGELAEKKRFFDLIFCDPPYGKDLIGQIVENIKTHNILAKDGIFVLEYSRHENFFLPAGLTIVRNEKYGETMVVFICNENSGGKSEKGNFPR